MGILDYLLLIIAFFLIAIISIQGTKDNINDAFSGATTDLFKNQKMRGSELFISRFTMFLVVVLIVLTIYVTGFYERY